ncbi:metal ABC transporter substrate-binding protein [Collinsella vaginalis]|uniref:metal ABC transporter substrate-binding protein n=1 Tax=Collinsella vaginalis TaxID=1870987 RepID=UPI000A26F085|nr:metal ABC transporter substrate-binding protein [Collinsella vaginalis]
MSTPARIAHPISRRSALAAFGLAALGGQALLAGCARAGSNTGSSASGALQVVASMYVMEDFTKKIGGDLVDVTTLVPSGTEPHDWEPSARDIEGLQSAALFVYNGAGMEHWADDVVSGLDASKVVEASSGITLLEGDHDHDSEDGDDGHDHDEVEYDPHVWLSPKNAKAELANIRDGLKRVDPDHASDYDTAFEEQDRAFDELDEEFRSRLSDLPNKTIVVSHAAYGYLCEAYGLTQRAITGVDAEGEPDAKTMASIIDFVKENNVKTIFTEELVSPKVAQSIADATGAECRVLSPVEGLTEEQEKEGADYLSLMRENLDTLVTALS